MDIERRCRPTPHGVTARPRRDVSIRSTSTTAGDVAATFAPGVYLRRYRVVRAHRCARGWLPSAVDAPTVERDNRRSCGPHQPMHRRSGRDERDRSAPLDVLLRSRSSRPSHDRRADGLICSLRAWARRGRLGPLRPRGPLRRLRPHHPRAPLGCRGELCAAARRGHFEATDRFPISLPLADPTLCRSVATGACHAWSKPRRGG